jgi:flagellar M-ring protein FliF
MERTLSSCPAIEWARVQFHIPEDRFFDDPENRTTASVTIQTVARLTPEQVLAIQNVVASGLPEIEPSTVKVMDSNLNVLTVERPSDAWAVSGETQLGIKQEYERMLQDKALNALSAVVGSGHARVQVNLDLDHVNEEIRENEIDEERGAVVSEQIRSEFNSNSAPGMAPGVDSNLPGEGLTVAEADKSQNTSEETIIETDYPRKEILRKRQGPVINKMTVSVLVDGTYEEGPDGTPVFVARPQADLDQLRLAVERAVGYDEARDGAGAITIACAPFQNSAVRPASAPLGVPSLLGDPGKIGIGILILALPIVCYLIFRQMDKNRERVRQDFHRQMDALLVPLRDSKAEEKETLFDFGLRDLSSLPEEEKRLHKMQEKLTAYAKSNTKEFADIVKIWMKE